MNLSAAKLIDRVAGGLLGGLVGGVDRLRELFAPPVPVEHVRHVLVVKFWGLGNWALLRPIVRDLRRHWPSARLTIVTLAGNAPMAADLADRLLVVRPSSHASVLGDLAACVRALRRDPPDLALDFEQFARAGALLARLGGARQRVGFRTVRAGRDGLYTVLVPFRRDAHAARSFRDLAEAAGVAPGDYVPGGLEPTDVGRAALAQAHGELAPYVVLHPGSGDNFPGRRWSASGFAAVGRTATAAGCGVVVTGGRSERDLVAHVAKAVGGGAVRAAGTLDVPGLVALLAGARALVSNDTGPVHIASSLGVPVLALFGPNTPALYAPLSPGSQVFYRDLPCSPCLTTSNYRSSRCRIHTCMAAISAGEVCAALARTLRVHRAREAPCVGSSD